MNTSRTYSPVGFCIYCGKSGAEHTLTDEHIVPLALGGTFVLPASSCKECTAVTGRFEQIVLRGCLRGAKERLALPTRSKVRPKTLPIFAVNGDENKKVQVRMEHYPATIALPAIPGPTLNGRYPPSSPANSHWAFVPPLDLEALEREYGVRSFSTNAIDVEPFARMLAKIAYSGAVAELGYAVFNSCLPGLILNERAQGYERYIGWSGEPVAKTNPESRTIHSYIFGTLEHHGHKYLICKLRLFANFGAPPYSIIVGQLREDYAPLAAPIWQAWEKPQGYDEAPPERLRLRITPASNAQQP